MKIVLAIDGSDFSKIAVKELNRITLPASTEICIINVYEFSESELSAWKHILTSYGAHRVELGIDTLNKALTINVYFNPKKDRKKSSDARGYKVCSWYQYVPNFIWIYCLLLVWNPTRYNLI